MKINLLSILLLGLLFAAGCSKKDDATTTPTPAPTPTPVQVDPVTGIVKTWKQVSSLILTNQGNTSFSMAQQTAAGGTIGFTEVSFSADGKYTGFIPSAATGTYKIQTNNTELAIINTSTGGVQTTTTYKFQSVTANSLQIATPVVAVNPLAANATNAETIIGAVATGFLTGAGKQAGVTSVQIVTTYELK